MRIVAKSNQVYAKLPELLKGRTVSVRGEELELIDGIVYVNYYEWFPTMFGADFLQRVLHERWPRYVLSGDRLYYYPHGKSDAPSADYII